MKFLTGITSAKYAYPRMLHGLFVRKEKVGKPLKVTFNILPVYLAYLVDILISVNDEEKGGVEL